MFSYVRYNKRMQLTWEVGKKKKQKLVNGFVNSWAIEKVEKSDAKTNRKKCEKNFWNKRKNCCVLLPFVLLLDAIMLTFIVFHSTKCHCKLSLCTFLHSFSLKHFILRKSQSQRSTLNINSAAFFAFSFSLPFISLENLF